MTILTVAIVASWLAAGYRVWVVVTQPRRIWRIAICVSMITIATAFTLYRFRIEVDRALGAWNVAGLAARVVFALGGGFLFVYCDALRRPEVPRGRIAAYLASGGVAALLMALCWTLAPIHDRYLDDLLVRADSWPVVAYCLVFWSFLAFALGVTSWTCLSSGRTFRRADPGRSAGLLLVGASSVAAIPALALWCVSIVLRHAGRPQAERLNALGDAIMPWPVLVNAVGVLSVITLPYLLALIATWRRGRQLEPLWRAMIERFPEVHLERRPRGGPLTRAQMRTERALIEIHDALRIARIEIDDEAAPSPELVGAALRDGSGGSRRVVDVLARADSRDDDIRQVLALARAFEGAKG